MNKFSKFEPFRIDNTMSFIKKAAARLPHVWQQELKRIHFRRKIRKKQFVTNEPEYNIIDKYLKPGDWAIDVGANVGHYTGKFSSVVGEKGRVIAFEPVPDTFTLLSANTTLFPNKNVTLINMAASNKSATVALQIPTFKTGLKNYYEAAISNQKTGLQVLSLAIDTLEMPKRIALLKIDAEGHDEEVLEGAEKMILRDKPTIIIESITEYYKNKLTQQGYKIEQLQGSPNTIFKF